MNELVVPPAPHWYKSSVMTCSPDNTLVYGSKHDIVIIKEKNPGQPAEVQMIHGAHSKHIVSVSLNKKWEDPHSYVASVGEDNVIKVWNLDTLEKKTSNKLHTEHKEPVIGAVFAGDDRIVSASSQGFVVVWNINTNETIPLNDLFKSKVTLTCLSSCPHAAWLLAFGLSNGCVVVADVRRSGQVLYRLRGHYQSVVSLSWCPAPVNIFPRYVNNRVKNKLQNDSATESAECSSGKTQETDTESKVNSEDIDVRVKENKVNPWINLTHADDDELALEKENPLETGAQDFLKECANLKKVILGLDVAKEDVTESPISVGKSVKRKNIKRQEIIEGRPLPKLFDPSGDFLDDSGFDDSAMKAFLECKEPDGASAEKEQNEKEEVGEKSLSSEDFSEDKDTGNEKIKNEVEDEGKESHPEKPTDASEGKDAGNEKNKDEKSEVEGEGGESHLEEATDASEGKDTGNEKNQDQTLEVEEEKNNTEDEPAKEEIIEEEPRTEYLLASSGKDRTIYIWRAGTDGRMQTYFYASKKVNRREKNPNSWISLCWITPDTILTSSSKGDIIAWPLPKPKESDKLFKVVHLEHSSTVFNIVAPPKYTTAFNWRDKVDTNIWTWGQDGKLVSYDLATEKVRYSYVTVSAMVTCFAPSPLDPNRLAIGLRDGSIRIWDLSLPHTNIITMQKHQQKITHKVSDIAWHPLKETVLGFGTEEGRVGFMDLASKKSNLFPHYFQSQVHKVEWGPINGDIANLGLYVVSEGKIAIYDMKKPDQDPVHLELPDKFYVYKFAWKPNHSLLLINGKDGSLVILKTDLEAVATVYPNDKGLNGIVWHPDAFTDDIEITPRCNWFAATTAKGIMVFDCTSIKENDSFADKVVATFDGHLRPPLALAWSPFEGNRIVSTAADGLSHVWDLSTKTVIATFVDSYFSHNTALAWSPIEPDLIIMGDKVLRIWNVSKNPPKIDEEFMAARKRFLAKFSKTEDKVDKNKIKVNIPVKPKSNIKSCIVPAFYVSNDENITSQVENMRKLIDGSGSEMDDSLQIFGGKEQVTRLLDANYIQQSKESKYKSCEMISLWKGNVGEYIQNAINENRVTPSVISLAPMVSPKLWQDACLTYAKKLSEDSNSDPLDTAMYFLACHKVEEAINCLCLNSMFKEAVALAKHRLPESSDIITKVVEEWAEHCKNTGNFENAAYCYISINDYENAAKVLSRRNHKEFLEFAVELAEKAGNKGLCDSIKFKYSEVQNSDSVDNVSSRIDAVLKDLAESEEKSETSSTVGEETQSEIGVEEVSVLHVTEQASEKTDNEEDKKIEE